jgi:hypothetical protein
MRQAVLAAAVAATVGAESLRVANNPGRRTDAVCELRQLWGDGTAFTNRAQFVADQGKAITEAKITAGSATTGRRLGGGFVSSEDCAHLCSTQDVRFDWLPSHHNAYLSAPFVHAPQEITLTGVPARGNGESVSGFITIPPWYRPQGASIANLRVRAEGGGRGAIKAAEYRGCAEWTLKQSFVVA